MPADEAQAFDIQSLTMHFNDKTHLRPLPWEVYQQCSDVCLCSELDPASIPSLHYVRHIIAEHHLRLLAWHCFSLDVCVSATCGLWSQPGCSNLVGTWFLALNRLATQSQPALQEWIEEWMSESYRSDSQPHKLRCAEVWRAIIHLYPSHVLSHLILPPPDSPEF